MVRASLKPGLLIVLAMSAASCLGVDLLAPAARITGANGSMQLEDGDSLLLEINFNVDPGTDAAARPLRVPDRTLRIEQHSLQPVDASFGILNYRAIMTLPAAVRDRLAVRFTMPAIPDANAAQFDVEIPILARTGSDRITLTPDEDLVLRSRRPDSLASGSRSSWILELAQTCNSGGGFVQFRASGEPPESFTIPASLLESVAPTTFQACLMFLWSATLSDGGYPVSLSSFTTLVWKIDITLSQPSGSVQLSELEEPQPQ